MRTLASLFSILIVTLLITGTVTAPTLAAPQEIGGSSHRVNGAIEEKVRDMERQQEKARNKRRQEDLKRDTDKLLQLATELKLYVDKSNEHVLSLDVIKKADEIEKLSKDIKNKMKGD